MSYVPLPIVDVTLANLKLDLDNYRIPTRPNDEGAALAYLFSSEDVIGAARQILRDGYFDNEVPIVIPAKDPGSYIVLEGNRRVSALKSLQDPAIVPAHRVELEALLRRYAVEAAELPTTIRAIVAKDRESAAPHIARLHSGLSKKRWSRDQQATFFYSLLNSSTTVDDIKATYPDESVVRFIKMAVMRRFLVAVKFSDKSLHDFVSGPDLTMSAFEYAYRPKEIAAAFGVAFSKDGFLEPTSKSIEKIAGSLTRRQVQALEYLMSEFRAGRLNTRSAEFNKKSPKFLGFVDRLTNGRGGGSAGPSGAAQAGSAPSGPAGGTGGVASPPAAGPGAAASSGSRGPNHPDTKKTLPLTGLDYTTHASVNLQLRYQELRRMNVDDIPAATAMMLRSILETTIKFHFEGTGTPAAGELKPSVLVLAKAYGSDKSLKASISKIQSGTAAVPGSVQWFNLVCHSADTVVSPKDVRDAFKLLEPVLRRLLRPATGA
ncbi:hypothetical protein [Schumannella luteola]